jgi:microcystin-dependent protein
MLNLTNHNIAMKRSLLVSVFALISLITITASGQTQRGFSFQGYARDFEGAALASQTITVRFSIYPQGGSNEFQEEQTVTTDPYGVYQVVIGATQMNNFSKLPFGTKNYWLKVETRANGQDFTETSNTQLLAVPYAKSAELALNGVPPGTILPFAGPKGNIPAGFLPCDGGLVSRTAYPDLYNAIGDSWGSSGASFRLPDLRGMFLRGQDDGANQDPDNGSRTARYSGGATGNNVGSYQNDIFGSHNHGGSTGTAGAHNHSVSRPDGWAEAGGSYWQDIVTKGSWTSVNTSTDGNHSHSISNSGGSETRPRNAAVYYIIKY